MNACRKSHILKSRSQKKIGRSVCKEIAKVLPNSLITLVFEYVPQQWKSLDSAAKVYFNPEFLTSRECDQLLKQATAPTTVYTDWNGFLFPRDTDKPVCESQWLEPKTFEPIHHDICNRFFAAWPYQQDLPKVKEDVHIRFEHYKDEENTDAYTDHSNWSLIVFLVSIERGREIIFPHINVQVQPKKGGAVLFKNNRFFVSPWLTSKNHSNSCTSLNGSSYFVQGEKDYFVESTHISSAAKYFIGSEMMSSRPFYCLHLMSREKDSFERNPKREITARVTRTEPIWYTE